MKIPQSDVVQFSIGVKRTPKFTDESRDAVTALASCEMALKLDLAYVLTKLVPSDNDTLPGWTGFNTQLREDSIPEVSRIGYLPVIDASPTEYSTIKTMLERSYNIADKLQLQYVMLRWCLTKPFIPRCSMLGGRMSCFTTVSSCVWENLMPSCLFCRQYRKYLKMEV